MSSKYDVLIMRADSQECQSARYRVNYPSGFMVQIITQT